MTDTSTIQDRSHVNDEGDRIDAADRDEARAERDAEIEREDKRREEEYKMLEITGPAFHELTDEEKNNVSNNGAGAKYAGYIRVNHNGKTLILESDAMEPEDAMFCRDLSWIAGALKKCYEIGKEEGKS